MAAAIQGTLSKEYFQRIGHDLSYVRQSGTGDTYHKNSLTLFPEEDMTWGMWTTALIAVDWFVQRYRGWDFEFQIVLVDEEDVGRWVRWEGEGYLWTLDELPPDGGDVV